MKSVIPSSSILFLLLFLISSSPLYAQWDFTFSDSDSNIERPYIYYVHVVDSNIVWAVLGNLDSPYSANEYLRTADSGLTWERGGTPSGGTTSYNVNIFAKDAQTAWVVSNTLPLEDTTRVYKTTDGGLTWQDIDFPYPAGGPLIAIHFFDDDEGFAYAEKFDGSDWKVECYFTTNGGDDWELADTPQLPGERIFIWHGNNNYSVHGDSIWFGTDKSRIFRSIDKGQSWEAFDVPFYHTRMAESVAFLDAQNGIVATALSDSLGGTLAYNDALRTEDGGQSWTRIPIPSQDLLTDPRMMGLCAIPGSDGVYMMYGYWQTDLVYNQMITEDHGLTWYYLDSPESKIRCMQFLSPTLGWGGGWKYAQLGLDIDDRMFKWTGPPLIATINTTTNAWNRLQASLDVYPNPSSDIVRFHLAGPTEKSYDLEIFDMSGVNWYSGELKTNETEILVISKWPNGTYIVKVSDSEGMTSRALIKQSSE